MKTCIVCKAPLESYRVARGACVWCYMRYRNAGRLDELRRTTWRAEDLLREVDILLQRKLTNAQIATTLGVKWDTICTARRRVARRTSQRKTEE